MNAIEKTYFRSFASKLHAEAHCTVLNRNLGIGYYRVIDGPEDNWAVVDRETAEEFKEMK